MLLALALALLASCERRERGPVVIVDPGPPFPPPARPVKVVGAHRTGDGIVIVIVRKDF